MREVTIRENEAGQRLDKFLHKYLPEAGSSFLYKMLRKKNITLNQKKCEGKEKLAVGDTVAFFLAEETLEKFGAGNASGKQAMSRVWEYQEAYRRIGPLPVIYEDQNVLFVNKPAGILTQKAEKKDVSLNEWLIGYLLNQGGLQAEELETFRPSVCNRLDRNTSGLVLCGKSLAGSQLLSRLLKERSMHKYYRMLVAGKLETSGIQEGYLLKDTAGNQVRIFQTDETGKGAYIRTGYRPIRYLEEWDVTYAEAELFTGKTHQIRAHLASLGHPLAGDWKYGTAADRKRWEKMGVSAQLLHAYRVEFPVLEEPFTALSGGVFLAQEPDVFRRFLAKED